MIYCEKTSDNQFAIQGLTEDQLAFLLDLANSTIEAKAAPIRRAIEREVRSHDKFTILIDVKIEICKKCKGEGTLRVGNLQEFHNHDKEECYRCKGAGRRKVVTTTRYENIGEPEIKV